MKVITTIFCLLLWAFSFGQKCICENDSSLSEIISCDTTEFDNASRIYWAFNCDSSWLTFESQTGQKEILFSLSDGLQNLTGRLGYIYAQEYKHTFLIQNNVISGCCTPPDFYVFDKTTGQVKDSLGSILYYSPDKKFPIIISITNNSNRKKVTNRYNSLSIYNIDKNRNYILKLPKGELEKALVKTEQIYPEYLFNDPVIRGTTIYLTYMLDKTTNRKKEVTKTITIDLKKYSL